MRQTARIAAEIYNRSGQGVKDGYFPVAFVAAAGLKAYFMKLLQYGERHEIRHLKTARVFLVVVIVVSFIGTIWAERVS